MIITFHIWKKLIYVNQFPLCYYFHLYCTVFWWKQIYAIKFSNDWIKSIFFEKARGYISNWKSDFFISTTCVLRYILCLKIIFTTKNHDISYHFNIMWSSIFTKKSFLMLLKSNTKGKIKMAIEVISTWGLKSNKR